MGSYQKMPTPTHNDESNASRCLPLLMCFHRKTSDEEVLERFMTGNTTNEVSVEEKPEEEKTEAKESRPEGKKKMFSLPKKLPKFPFKLPKTAVKKTKENSEEETIPVVSVEPVVAKTTTTTTTPPPKTTHVEPSPKASPPSQKLKKERSYDSNRSAGQITKLTSPSTPPPKEHSLRSGHSPTVEESSIASVDAYNNKDLMPVSSIETFIMKSKEKKKKSKRHQQQPIDEDEGSMISVLTMDPVLQAISRREAEGGISPIKSPKKKNKKLSDPSGSKLSTNNNSEWEATMIRMTNPYDASNPAIEEGEDEDEGSDALSEIAPLDLVSL